MKKVLVVDDEKAVVEVVSRMAEEAGFAAFEANSLQEALIIFNQEKPGIIITDIMIHDTIGGVVLCNQVKMCSPKIFVIAMTGYISDYDLAYCIGAGFNDVIQKPIRYHFLEDVLECAYRIRKRWLTLNGCIQEEEYGL